MSECPECGAALDRDASECFQCHARFDDRRTAAAVRRQARRGALQGTLIAAAFVVVFVIAISMLIQACIS